MTESALRRPEPTEIKNLLVRVYLTESRANMARVMTLLHASGKIRGATAFRGCAGFGSSGSFYVEGGDPPVVDRPVVLEFFDTEASVGATITYIKSLVAPRHIIVIPVIAMPI